MSTNYYLYEKPACECCGREYEAMHIGTTGTEWNFAVHVIPEERINSLDDWRTLWSKPGAFIRDEYGREVSIEEMERIITRPGIERPLRPRPLHPDHCIGHGEGPWDYVIGNFC
jgi:hypothetical protein